MLTQKVHKVLNIIIASRISFLPSLAEENRKEIGPCWGLERQENQKVSSTESEGGSEGGQDDEEDEKNLGPKSNISLLDQHSDLKRKAEGNH